MTRLILLFSLLLVATIAPVTDAGATGPSVQDFGQCMFQCQFHPDPGAQSFCVSNCIVGADSAGVFPGGAGLSCAQLGAELALPYPCEVAGLVMAGVDAAGQYCCRRPQVVDLAVPGWPVAPVGYLPGPPLGSNCRMTQKAQDCIQYHSSRSASGGNFVAFCLAMHGQCF